MRIETIGDATLYLGDCLEILPTVEQVQCVVTDPPYGMDYQCARRTASERFTKIANDKNLDFMPELLRAMYLLTPRDAHAYVFCRWDKWGQIGWGNWACRNMLVWDKGQHGTGDLADSYGPQHELCAFLTKGRRGFSSERPVDVLRVPKVQPMQLAHSCEKPVALMEKLIRASSTTGETILDPFMGSGTTGVACANLGRKFIGIEIEEKYFDIACERISAAYAQGRLFA